MSEAMEAAALGPRHDPPLTLAVFDEVAEWQAWVKAGQPAEPAPMRAVATVPAALPDFDPEAVRAAAQLIVELIGAAFRNAVETAAAIMGPVFAEFRATFGGLAPDATPEPPRAPLNRAERRAGTTRAGAGRAPQNGPQRPLRPPRELGRQRGKGAWR